MIQEKPIVVRDGNIHLIRIFLRFDFFSTLMAHYVVFHSHHFLVPPRYMKPADREAFGAQLQKAEDWLYDNFEATTVELIDKLQELKDVGNPVQGRFDARKAIEDYQPRFEQSIREIRALAGNPSEE